MTRNYKTTWTASQTLRAYIGDVALWPDDSATKKYQKQYAVNSLEKFLGRPALLRDLNDETFTMFFEWLPVSGRTVRTVQSVQNYLLMLGRHAAERGIIEWPMPTWQSRIKLDPATDVPTNLGLLRYFEDVFLDGRETEFSKETIKAYRSSICAYQRFSSTRASVRSVSPRTLKKFRQWLIDRGMNRKAAGNRAFAVAAVAKHANPTRFKKTDSALRQTTDGGRPLAEVFEKLYLPEKQSIGSPNTERQYRIAIESFGRQLGHIATLNDLTDAKLGSYMRALRNQGLAIRTVNGYRSKLLALWRWCNRKRLADEFPTVEQIPPPKELPVAWTRADLRKLLKACSAMPGQVGDVPAGLWWRALHFVAWDTGERAGALLALRWDMLDACQLVVPAAFRKGRRKPMLYTLKRSTIRALAAIEKPERDLIFLFPRTNAVFYSRYKRLLKLAGLPYVKHKSALQKMRRSFATHVEAAGGDATEALAHSARSLTVDSYIDPRMIARIPANELLFALEAATA